MLQIDFGMLFFYPIMHFWVGVTYHPGKYGTLLFSLAKHEK